MPNENRSLSPPRQLRIGRGADAASFVLSETHVALHGLPPGKFPKSSALVFAEEGIAVTPRTIETPRGARRGPVYTMAPGASFAVPTGRIFLRMAEGQSVEPLRAAFEKAGFSIEEIPVYAPNGAWLGPNRDITSALATLPTLRKLAGVVNVEPELLTQRAPR